MVIRARLLTPEEGYLPCPSTWKIAKKAKVPKIPDRLSIRISNCQIGIFKIGKILSANVHHQKIDEMVIVWLKHLPGK